MNLLIDFVSLCRKNGAAEYLRRVIDELLSTPHDGVTLYGVYDSSRGIAYDDMQPDKMKTRGIMLVDMAGRGLLKVIEEGAIDRFFIGCSQVLSEYPEVENITCEVICVPHDLSFEELQREDLDIYMRVQNKSFKSFVYWLLFKMQGGRKRACFILPIANLMKKNDKVMLIAVSEYTRQSLIYTYGIDESRICVLYSPERIYNDAASAGNVSDDVARIVATGKKILLLLGTQHHTKNTRKALHAFGKFHESHDDYILVSAGRQISPVCAGHYSLGFLTDDDLRYLYENCHALIYPTLFEGFGYPPIEAMHYGKPVLASNIGPVREVLADSPIYFSPLYETDVFAAMSTLATADYKMLSSRSMERYAVVRERQQKDLHELLSLLLK